jgi:16S rRNA (adenine1518-N6/adenine1519-N6)-dimethyltransferase
VNKLPRAKRELGQHFLRDTKVISGITSNWSEECDVIIEVGPGPAILTQDLSKLGKPFFVIEKDESFKPYLEKFLPDENIYFSDALKFDWDTFLDQNNLRDKKIWLVSNLPYNVGTILFIQFLQIKEIEFMTLMFQKEVGDKTYLRQGNNQMNGLLFLSVNYFDSKQLLKVPPGSFAPPPKVDSVVVSFSRKPTPDIAINQFDSLNKFTRNLFGQKRKQIGTVLKQNYALELLESAFVSSDVSRQRRAESLTYDEVFKLFSNLK